MSEYCKNCKALMEELDELRDEVERLKDRLRQIYHVAGEVALDHGPNNISPLNIMRNLRAEVERLNKLRAHCEHCGGDYAVTGIESGCPCRIIAERDELRAKLDALQGACEAVVATAHGNTYGSDIVEVINANRYAAGEVIRILGAEWAKLILARHGHSDIKINTIISATQGGGDE